MDKLTKKGLDGTQLKTIAYGLALAQENFKDIRFHFTSEF